MLASLHSFLEEEVLRRTPSCAHAMQMWQCWRAPYRALSQRVQKNFSRRERRERRQQWRARREHNQEVVFQEIHLRNSLRALQEQEETARVSAEQTEVADPAELLQQRGIPHRLVKSERTCPVCQEERCVQGVIFSSCGHFLCTDPDKGCLQQFLSSFPPGGVIPCPLCRVTLCGGESSEPHT